MNRKCFKILCCLLSALTAILAEAFELPARSLSAATGGEVSAPCVVMAPDEETPIAEAVYVSTDKDVYVAGDLIFCSVFCVNPLDGCKLSTASSLAYLELVSGEGTAVEAKIALIGGRGSGAVPLPLNISTGNYRLYAYTSLGRGEIDPQLSYKTISVFNTLYGERVPDGVKVVGRSEYVDKLEDEISLVKDGDVKLYALRGAASSTVLPLSIENGYDEAVTMSVSVYCVDDIVPPANSSLSDFISSAPASAKTSCVVPDFEGEAVKGHLVGSSAGAVCQSNTYVPVISSPGATEDLYAGDVSPDGTVSFSTGNIYGKKDIFCEILRLEDGMDCRFLLDSPFINPQAEDIPPVEISTAMYDALSRRSLAMQQARSADLDTLYEYLPKRESLLFSDLHYTQYHLDDYTRFPTIKDIFVEFVPTVRIRKGARGRKEVQVLLEDLPGNVDRFSDGVLVLLDGVPVSNHERLLNFDAMLLSDIFIYPYTYIAGNYSFKGVVNLVTYSHNISSLKFDDNLVIVDFQGASYPVAFTGAKGVGVSTDRADGAGDPPGAKGVQTPSDAPSGAEERETSSPASTGDPYQDLRGTLYWHPQIEVAPGKTVSVEIHTPSYVGNFKAVAEGITASGIPFTYQTSFEVR